MKNICLSSLIVLTMLFCVNGFSADLPGNPYGGKKSEAISADFRAQLSEALKVYFELEKLVFKGETKNAAEKAIFLQKAFFAIEQGSLPETMLAGWQEQLRDLQSATDSLASEEDLSQQREAFLDISNVLIAMVKDYRPLDFTVYLYHCPMAVNTGGHWLTDTEEIANPFFGDEMATCGTLIVKYGAKQ